MPYWERYFSDEILKESKQIKFKSVKKTDKREITAYTDDGHCIIVPVVCNSPYFPMCDCESNTACIHKAAIRYYLEEHQELLNDKKCIDDILNNISENKIKRFLKKEFKTNKELESKFLKEFSNESVIDEIEYRKKLNNILNLGKDPNFDLEEWCNIDIIEKPLYEFMKVDIDKLFNAKEFNLACDLLYEIAEVLSNETAQSYDSWYNLAEEFLEWEQIMIESIYVDEEDLRKLENKSYKIAQYI